MRIVQIAHAVSYGDAASNQILAMDRLLKEIGYHSVIYAGKVDPQLGEGVVRAFDAYRHQAGDVVIYHFSTGTSFTDKILGLPTKIVLYYHNITPAEYFSGIAWGSYFAARKGRKQLQQLKAKTLFAWGASEYSRRELEGYGFGQTAVLPIVVDFTQYAAAAANPQIIDKYKDGKVNLLFVGRVTPHKRQEDLIRILYYYKRFVDRQVRLLLVGGQKKAYLTALQALARALDVADSVVFAGKVPFADLCTYYQVADAFVCMSEHEGFCVPLLEASYYQLPVAAFRAAALPFTMGNSGVLFDKKDYPLIAETLRLLRDDAALRQAVVAAQLARLTDFSPKKLKLTVQADLAKVGWLMAGQ